MLRRAGDEPSAAVDADSESDGAGAAGLHDEYAGAVAVLAQQRRDVRCG